MLATINGVGHRLWFKNSWFFSAWCVIAAFGTYACMYGFRKPFTAGTYVDATTGLSIKAWLVTAQVLGYTLSKFIGIQVIAEMRAGRRVAVLLGLIFAAEMSLLAFALTPPPLNAIWLFFNGLPLGMVFGLVLGFLEGRKQTEAFVAGLCASFILADGMTKSVGGKLLLWGIPENWMPFTAGLLFIMPLAGFVWMLHQVPAPSSEDIKERSQRSPMLVADRRRFLARHGVGLGFIVLVYLLVTILRSFRADFAPEIWTGLGTSGQPGVFTQSEIWVALGVVAINGSIGFIRNNRLAFFAALGLSVAGVTISALAVWGLRLGLLNGFQFMVLVGLGMYIPYVAVHTTIFERFIAMTRDQGNIGFLMYLADAFGYLGYVGVMLGRRFWQYNENTLNTFLLLTLVVSVGSLILLGLAAWFFHAVEPLNLDKAT